MGGSPAGVVEPPKENRGFAGVVAASPVWPSFDVLFPPKRFPVLPEVAFPKLPNLGAVEAGVELAGAFAPVLPWALPNRPPELGVEEEAPPPKRLSPPLAGAVLPVLPVLPPPPKSPPLGAEVVAVVLLPKSPPPEPVVVLLAPPKRPPLLGALVPGVEAGFPKLNDGVPLVAPKGLAAGAVEVVLFEEAPEVCCPNIFADILS